MFVQQRHARESLVTFVALVLFHIAVSLHVCAKVRSISERSRADITLERFLSGVGSDVSLQQPRSTEAFAADFTLTRQSVRSDVHFESAQRRVRLFAVFTREAFGDLGATVKLFVLGQAAKCRVALAAAVALVSRQVRHVRAGVVRLARIDQAVVVVGVAVQQ